MIFRWGPRSTLRMLGLFGGSAVFLALLTWVSIPTGVGYVAACALLWMLPALRWSRALPGDRITRLASGLGLAFVSSGLLTLGLHSLPGAFPRVGARIVYAIGAVLPLVLQSGDGKDIKFHAELMCGLVLV